MPKIVVFGGSAGSINALKVILRSLPSDFAAPVLIVTHIGPRESILPSLLQSCSALPVRHAVQGEPIVPGQVLIAPPDLHLTIVRNDERAFASLSRGPKENHSRPAIDPLLRSAAITHGAGVIAVLLSGFIDDGTVGLQAVKAYGGTAVVQDPGTAEVPDMPFSALRHASVDVVCRVDDIAPVLVELVSRPASTLEIPAESAEGELQNLIAVENRMFNEGADMEELDQIGSRVPLTCPECGGAIWEMRQPGPLRYRCHTGHAFSAGVLEGLQCGNVEEALWAAVRALHEQEQLLRQMHRSLGAYQGRNQPGDSKDEYLVKAEQTGRHAQLLRDLIASRMRIGSS